MLAFTITLLAYTALAAVAPKLESEHHVQLHPNSFLVGAFDTVDIIAADDIRFGFGFATLDSSNNLSVYTSDGNEVTPKPLQTAVTKKSGVFGFRSATLTLRAPVKGYAKSVAYMLVDGKTLVDRDILGATEGVQYELKGATGSAFDVDGSRIAYVKDNTSIVILNKSNTKEPIVTLPVRGAEKRDPREIRNLELEGNKLAITYRGYYQVVDFSNVRAPKTELEVRTDEFIRPLLVTTNVGRTIYHATMDEGGLCKAYVGGIKGHKNVVTKELSFSFEATEAFEFKAGKEAVIAISGPLKEVMTVRADAGQALVQRFKLEKSA